MINTVVFLTLFIIRAHAYWVEISSNAPVVLGATIEFRAELFDDDGNKPDKSITKLMFTWTDNAIPVHKKVYEGYNTVSTWNVTYSKQNYGPGMYEVQVTVARVIIFSYNIASSRQYFNVTSLLNGKLDLVQRNASVEGDYVSSDTEVSHQITLHNADAQLINSTATSITTYWFIDCIYYGMTDDLSFRFNYTNATDQERNVEALVVVSYDVPEPTTVAPTSTVSPNSTTSTEMYPTIAPGTNVSGHPVLPYVCINSSVIPADSAKTYGYFYRKLEVKAPVSNVVVSGARWLHDGELLNLGVSCNGSSPFVYCIKIVPGEYNATGNEDCLKERIITECKANVSHYFRTTNTSTVVIIIKNEISKKVSAAVINIYEVAKQPQLSVIVVPVSCSALAVILIVFGAAYYIQSKKRYTIEVADFDFAQANDMEYMTFRERLRDSINRALNRTHDYDNEDSVWSPSRKYGSMQ